MSVANRHIARIIFWIKIFKIGVIKISRSSKILILRYHVKRDVLRFMGRFLGKTSRFYVKTSRFYGPNVRNILILWPLTVPNFKKYGFYAIIRPKHTFRPVFWTKFIKFTCFHLILGQFKVFSAHFHLNSLHFLTKNQKNMILRKRPYFAAHCICRYSSIKLNGPTGYPLWCVFHYFHQ